MAHLHRGEFVLTGVDPASTDVDDRSPQRRLVCLIEGGGKLVIWGRDENRQHIDEVLTAGFPCLVECDWREPDPAEDEAGGPVHWIEESVYMRVL